MAVSVASHFLAPFPPSASAGRAMPCAARPRLIECGAEEPRNSGAMGRLCAANQRPRPICPASKQERRFWCSPVSGARCFTCSIRPAPLALSPGQPDPPCANSSNTSAPRPGPGTPSSSITAQPQQATRASFIAITATRDAGVTGSDIISSSATAPPLETERLKWAADGDANWPAPIAGTGMSIPPASASASSATLRKDPARHARSSMRLSH